MADILRRLKRMIEAKKDKNLETRVDDYPNPILVSLALLSTNDPEEQRRIQQNIGKICKKNGYHVVNATFYNPNSEVCCEICGYWRGERDVHKDMAINPSVYVKIPYHTHEQSIGRSYNYCLPQCNEQ